MEAAAQPPREGAPQASLTRWSFMGIRETYERLQACIAAIEEGRGWTTPYGMQQERQD
jgi:hypothetical protein